MRFSFFGLISALFLHSSVTIASPSDSVNQQTVYQCGDTLFTGKNIETVFQEALKRKNPPRPPPDGKLGIFLKKHYPGIACYTYQFAKNHVQLNKGPGSFYLLVFTTTASKTPQGQNSGKILGVLVENNTGWRKCVTSSGALGESLSGKQAPVPSLNQNFNPKRPAAGLGVKARRKRSLFGSGDKVRRKRSHTQADQREF